MWSVTRVTKKMSFCESKLTAFLITDNITTSTIARGISVGDDLEYADEITLGRSITDRIPFEKSLKG